MPLLAVQMKGEEKAGLTCSHGMDVFLVHLAATLVVWEASCSRSKPSAPQYAASPIAYLSLLSDLHRCNSSTLHPKVPTVGRLINE